ncbi:hypothetical protein Taro_050596 [Colocasia esculenta]|uniref:Uncharacterized protein n=1 Tax=Colocasia esculenta TaxID=4460 RepID=A0A843XED0_COLES|nr:hypothetical protein [Colocasia esculenta]
MTSTVYNSTTPPEKVVYQPQTITCTGYRYLLPRGTTTEITRHTSTSKTSTSESHTHEPQPVAKHESKRTTPPYWTDY